MSEKFHSGERLKSRKAIGRLFTPAGRAVKAYPLRLAFAEAETVRGTFPYQVGFVVPKRRFKRAVDRNRIKRLMREAYRLESHLIGAHTTAGTLPERQLTMMFIYTGSEEVKFAYLRKRMRQVLAKLNGELEQ